MVAMGGNLGLRVSLEKVPANDVKRNDSLMFSESAGRFIVSVDPENRTEFENIFSGHPCACIGEVTAESDFVIKGADGRQLLSSSVQALKIAWKKPFGDLI